MVLNQPALSKAQWRTEVEKMRTAYKAPIDPKDVDTTASTTSQAFAISPRASRTCTEHLRLNVRRNHARVGGGSRRRPGCGVTGSSALHMFRHRDVTGWLGAEGFEPPHQHRAVLNVPLTNLTRISPDRRNQEAYAAATPLAAASCGLILGPGVPAYSQTRQYQPMGGKKEQALTIQGR